MSMFYLLFENLIPLYVLIALGWTAGRLFDVDIKSLGALGIYVFMPIAVWGFVVELDFKPIYIGLPLVSFLVTTVLGLSWYIFSKKIYADNRTSLLTMCATWGNTGYFALPLVIALFPADLVGVYMFMMAGSVFYEATIGYYIWMRGNLDVRESILKVLKFPAFHAIILGLIMNLSGYELQGHAETYWNYFKGAYIVVGMMIVGGALARVSKLTIAPRFISLSFFGKFIIWPGLAFALIMLDKNLFHVFDRTSHQMFFILSIVPPGANIAAFAAKLDMRPEKAATTILLGTLFALLYVPAILAISGLF